MSSVLIRKLNVLPSRGAFKQQRCSLLLVLCPLLLVGCNALTGPKVDLLKQISDEVDWANASKLKVRLEYPPAWGISNPQQGGITPAMDIRRGYEFSLEFTPDMAYTLTAWLAYKTSDLPPNWLEDPKPLDTITTTGIQALGPGEVTLPVPNVSGGLFKFIIHTTEPVTLVPSCETQPRIIRTEPRDSPNGPPYLRSSYITLYFNGALDTGTVTFMNNPDDEFGIWITDGTDNNSGIIDGTDNGKHWYTDPVFSIAGGFFTVTMETNSANPPPIASTMTVTVKGIKNIQGNEMADKYTFSWKTQTTVGATLQTYSAKYNENEKSIRVTWTRTNPTDDTVTVKTSYRLNSGSKIEFAETEKDSPKTLSGISAVVTSGIRGGSGVSDIKEYEIIIELFVEGGIIDSRSLKIWNIPGMEVAMEVAVDEKSIMSNGMLLAKEADFATAFSP